MRNTLIGILLIFPLFAFSQERPLAVVPSRTSTDIAVPRMEKGLVDGRTYKNPAIGVEFTVLDGLAFQTPELKGTPGTVPLLVTVTALRMEHSSAPRLVTAFYADALAYYPKGQRSTDAYVRKVVAGNRKTGYEPVAENVKVSFGGAPFVRTDFQGPLYEAVLVKACDSQALVFIFASFGKDAVDKLIAETNLKLDAVRSGCRLDSHTLSLE